MRPPKGREGAARRASPLIPGQWVLEDTGPLLPRQPKSEPRPALADTPVPCADTPMVRQTLPFVLAVASGGLLTLMVLFNGQWAANGTVLLSSWMAHGTGTLAALVFLGLLRFGPRTLPTPMPAYCRP